MEIYLPIAEMSVNVFLLLGLGAGVGLLSGIFGVGGGFIMTPLLITIGIPPSVAVGTQASQILAASFSSIFPHIRRRSIDIRMGLYLIGGGLLGSAGGVAVFTWLRKLGQINTVISLSYVLFLGFVGALMLIESLSSLYRRRRGGRRLRLHRHYWIHGLPLRLRFPHSRLFISILVPIGVGALGGVAAAILGIGGGFVLLPAMIYLIGMPTAVVIGTSHFQICFVAALTTMLQAYNNQNVDIVLALMLIAGGVVGAQLGTRAGARLPSEQLRILLGMLVLFVCGRLAYELVRTPVDLFSLAN